MELSLPEGILSSYKGKQYRARHNYYDATEKEVITVVRYEAAGQRKVVVPYSKNGSKWEIGIQLEPRILYGLPHLLKTLPDKPVIIVEGEPKVVALQALGFTAVTSLGGAESPHRSDWSPLSGRAEVYFMPDNDDAGEKYIHSVRDILSILPNPPKMHCVRLAGLPDKGDIIDWIKTNLEFAWNGFDRIPSEKAKELRSKLIPIIKEKATSFPESQKDISPLISVRKEESTEEWPEPIPLKRAIEAEEPYPVHCFPTEIRDAISQYQRYGQQPLSLVGGSALSSLSLAVQGRVDVARDERLISPSSLYLLIIAESGERKTAADSEFSKGIRQWQEEYRASLKSDIHQQRVAMNVWQAKSEGIKAKIKNLYSGKKEKDIFNREENLRELTHQMVELENNKPLKIRIPEPPYEVITCEALQQALAEGWPSASLRTDEGGLFVGSYSAKAENATSFFAFFNRLWDGNSFSSRTKTSGQISFVHRRFTCSLMLQETVLRTLLNVGKGVSRGTGFLARMLISCPQSTMGQRFYKTPEDNLPALENFQRRLKTILSWGLPMDIEGNLSLKTLYLSDEAKHVWEAYYNDIESQLKPFGEFVDIKDFTSKSAENAARIAANFHVYEHGEEGEISESCMKNSCELARWYLRETRKILSVLQTSQEFLDADLLLSWFIKEQKETVKSSYLLRYGPPSLRKKERRDPAIKVLEENGYLKEELKSGKSKILRLNPCLLEGN